MKRNKEKTTLAFADIGAWLAVIVAACVLAVTVTGGL